MDVDASCVLMLLQCRDREWYGDSQGNEAWARVAAQRCIGRGFGVLRVPTQNWADVKCEHPEWFSPVFDENLCEQQVICTINFIHVLCPMLEKVHSVLQSEDSVWHCENHGFMIHVPDGIRRISTDLYVVCEASSNIAPNLSPSGLRLIYGYYSEPVLWCGFNMKAQTTGSKGVMGDAASLLVLGDCLQRLLLYHIDQTYKALRSPFFGLVQRKKRNHICFGYLRHRSQCCNSSRGDMMPMSAEDYTPNPVIPERLYIREKKRFTVEEALLGALGVTTQVRGPRDVTDVVCLRLQSYMRENDPIFSADNYSVMRRLEVVRRSLNVAQAALDSGRLELLVESQNTAMHGDSDTALGVIDAEVFVTAFLYLCGSYLNRV